MVIHMKTTLNIDDSVVQRLREEAARRGSTMSELVEAGLRYVLGDEPVPASGRRALLPLPRWRSGGVRVDLADRGALHDLMDGP
jgi:plasmid stability protein